MTGKYPLTEHARRRMDARRIAAEAVAATLRFGRRVHVRGAVIYAIGKREARKWARRGVNLSRHEGLQVVCSHEGAVLTVYRNRELRGLRPHRHRRNSRRRAAALGSVYARSCASASCAESRAEVLHARGGLYIVDPNRNPDWGRDLPEGGTK
jgi:hypothetical protein